MKPSEVTAALRTAVKANIPTIIWGPPGVGKSEITRQVAMEYAKTEDVDECLVDIRLLQFDPVDLRGLPSVGDGVTLWNNTPSFFPREETHGPKGILFLDELCAAPTAVQAVAYQLMLERRLGEYRLPAGWIPMAASNRASDKAVSNRMPTPLANRMMHLDIEVDFDDWKLWALRHEITPHVIAFLTHRPGLLDGFDAKSDSKAFPSPRTWSYVHRLTLTGECNFNVLKGTIGEGAASEYDGFLRMYESMITVDDILKNPTKAPLPEESEPDKYCAIASAVAHKLDADNIGALIKYIHRMDQEYACMCLRDAGKRNYEIALTEEFAEWAQEHKDILELLDI